MPDMELIKLLLTGIALPLFFFLSKKIGELENKLENHKLYSANHFLKKEDLSEFKKEIKALFTDFKQDFHKTLDELKHQQSTRNHHKGK